MKPEEYASKLARRAQGASRVIRTSSPESRNHALENLVKELDENRGAIIEANQRDVKNARTAKLSNAMIDRLALDDSRIDSMIDGVREVIALPDPVGEISEMVTRPNGLKIGRMRVPIGTILIIYESRPNVTIDAGVLCFKSGNAVVLRGGSEAVHTNTALANLMRKAIEDADLPLDSVLFVEDTSREVVSALLTESSRIDMVIPRGGESLIRAVSEQARMPVVKHFNGVCHVYVDESADKDMAVEICFNAKVQRPGVCNAMETMLVHKSLSKSFLPVIVDRLRTAGVELRGCPKTVKLFPDMIEASRDDWSTEYLDLILSVRIVEDIDEAIDHIEKYGSGHSDAIVTNNHAHAMRFLSSVDSAAVYVNASTRFTDGYQFGLGAEIGISTDKVHARGPMGLRELTIQKWIILGDGQVRS